MYLLYVSDIDGGKRITGENSTTAGNSITVVNSIRVILLQLFQIPSCVYMKGKFVTNVSFATVRLINHP
jgi:hypothetical protein